MYIIVPQIREVIVIVTQKLLMTDLLLPNIDFISCNEPFFISIVLQKCPYICKTAPTTYFCPNFLL